MNLINKEEIVPNNLEQNNQISLQAKIQKLIDNYASLKERFTELQTEKELLTICIIELEDEKSQWMNEKIRLEQKIMELEEMASDYNSVNKTVVSKIDELLAQIESE